MVSRSFRINIFWRLALLMAAGYGAVHFLLYTPYWMLSVWMFAGVVGLAVALVRYAEKNYRSLGDFLMAIDQNDFSYLGNMRKLKKDSRLGAAFNHIADMMEGLRMDAQASYQYLQTVVQHVEVGILCYDERGRISLFNKAARELLGVPQLSHVRFLYHLDPDFHRLVVDIQPGERKLYRREKEDRLYHLSVLATRFKKEAESFKLVSFQNIKGELEEKEMESWYRLTRVLTHEIMNSAIPISNLSGMVYETLVTDEGHLRATDTMADDEADEMKVSLQTIQSRSRGLVRFVNSTRQITRLPDPELQPTDLVKLIRRIHSLYAPKLKEQGVDGHLDIPESPHRIKADAGQLEQVMINLLQNAIEAVAGLEHPAITISLRSNEKNQTELRVVDNGPGIPPEVRENLFVPFYTTRRNGSGIGLSLSRHIIHNHKGRIEVKTREGAGSEFIIYL